MAKVHKISIALTNEHYELIQKAVASGDYASTSEVIRDALRSWEKLELLRQMERDRLVRLWDEGIASGPSVEGPQFMEKLIAKLEAEAAMEDSREAAK